MLSRPPPPPLPDLTGHFCRADGCRRFGSRGFGPPKATAGAPAVRWYCWKHEGEGRAWWSGGGAGEAVADATVQQGSLF